MTTENYGAPPPEDGPKPTFGKAEYWDANAKDSVFVKWQPKDSKEVPERLTQLQGNFDACWKEWDDGRPDEDIKAGWRFRLRLKNKDGNALVVRMGAAVYIYSLIAKLHEIGKGAWIAINIRNGGQKKTVAFPDVSVWDGQAWHDVRGIDLDRSGDRLAEALALIEQHGAYIQPPKKADPNNMTSMACAEAEAKGWPAIGLDTEQLYLELIAEATPNGELFDGLADVPDPIWASFRQWMKDTQDPPVKIRAYLKRAHSASAASIAAQAPAQAAAPAKTAGEAAVEAAMEPPAPPVGVTPEYDPYEDE